MENIGGKAKYYMASVFHHYKNNYGDNYDNIDREDEYNEWFEEFKWKATCDCDEGYDISNKFPPGEFFQYDTNLFQDVVNYINDYYIETIEGGKVYDSKKNEVGVLINGQMELNIGLITQLKNLEIQINDIQKDKNISVPNINNFKKDDDAFCSVIKKTPILIPISKSDIMIEPLNLQSNVPHNTVKSSDGINLKQNISNSQYQIENLSTISPFRVECSPPKGGGTSPAFLDECSPPKNKQLLNNEILLDKPPAKRINKRRNNASKI